MVEPTPPDSPGALAPLRTRLLVFAVLVVIALGSIWLIDRRAMSRMQQYQQSKQTQTQPASPTTRPQHD